MSDPVDRLGVKVGTQVTSPTSFVPSADLAIKTPVLCATTAAITLSGLQTIDGITVVEGSRVLVKDQTDLTTNGIYNASSGVWSRSADLDGNDDFAASQIIFVHSGTVNASTLYQLVATDPVIIDTSNLQYTRVSFPPLGTLNATSPVLVNGTTSAPLNVDPTVSLLANGITYALFQKVAASSLVGNPTGVLATAQGITLGATLAFSSAVLQTAAGSGDVSWSANSFVTAIGANKVTDAMIRQGVARSVIGVAGNATANVADIQGTANQVLVVNAAGTALAFGQVNLAAAAAVTGTLPSTLGGTDNASYAVGDLLQASATTTLARLAAVSTGNALISGGVGTVSSWGKIGLTTHISGTLAAGNGGTGATSLGSEFTVAATVFHIANNGITYALFQQVAALSLVGNATGSTATATGITLGATLAFSGSALQTAALTGDVTASANSFVTTVAKIQGTTVSGTTGSGNVVFSTSASLTSPAISGSPTITGLGTPSASSDAATKGYVDSVAQGLSAKPSAIVATATTLPTYIYANGSSGAGATITFVATGVVAIDGHDLALNDVVLIKNETAGNAPYNGLYTVTLAPAIGVAGILTRHTSMDTTGEFAGGFIFVETGTVNAAAGFVCTNSSPPTVGTTAISFTQFSGAGQITVTAELTKTGNQLSITTNGVTYALFQQVAASRLLGNPTGSLANASEISIGATLAFSGTALQTAAITGDVTASANSFITTLATNIVSNAKFRQSAAFSVVGNSTSSTANVADISTTTGSAAVLRESGGALGFGTVATAGIANNAITYAKLQQVAAVSLVGNATGSLADATGITLGATLAFSGSALQTAALTGDVTASANSFATTIAANAVTNAKMATMANNTIKSNISGGVATPSDNTLTAILDTLTTTQGSIIYRGASNWTVLTPGTSGDVLTTNGASNNPSWATGGGGGGSSVTDGWVEHGHFGGV